MVRITTFVTLFTFLIKTKVSQAVRVSHLEIGKRLLMHNLSSLFGTHYCGTVKEVPRV